MFARDKLLLKPGDWAWSIEDREACRVVEAQDLWGEEPYRVWVPSRDAIVRARGDQLRSTWDNIPGTAAWVSSLAVSERVVYVLYKCVLHDVPKRVWQPQDYAAIIAAPPPRSPRT